MPGLLARQIKMRAWLVTKVQVCTDGPYRDGRTPKPRVAAIRGAHFAAFGGEERHAWASPGRNLYREAVVRISGLSDITTTLDHHGGKGARELADDARMWMRVLDAIGSERDDLRLEVEIAVDAEVERHPPLAAR